MTARRESWQEDSLLESLMFFASLALWMVTGRRYLYVGPDENESVGLLRYDVDVHGRGITQEAVNGSHVKEFSPPLDRRPSENHLRDVPFAHEYGCRMGDSGAIQGHHFGAQTLGKLTVGGKGFLIRVA